MKYYEEFHIFLVLGPDRRDFVSVASLVAKILPRLTLDHTLIYFRCLRLKSEVHLILPYVPLLPRSGTFSQYMFNWLVQTHTQKNNGHGTATLPCTHVQTVSAY